MVVEFTKNKQTTCPELGPGVFPCNQSAASLPLQRTFPKRPLFKFALRCIGFDLLRAASGLSPAIHSKPRLGWFLEQSVKHSA
jgi:hypothetical protein